MAAARTWRLARRGQGLAEIDPSLGAPPAGDPMLRSHLAELLRADPTRLVVTAGVRFCAAQLMQGCRLVVVERPTLGYRRDPRALADPALGVGTRWLVEQLQMMRGHQAEPKGKLH